jgi:hypothetical protein
MVIMLPELFKKEKRIREQNVANDNEDDDDEDEPQSPWSQQEEQNHIIVPLSTNWVIVPNLYTTGYRFVLLNFQSSGKK